MQSSNYNPVAESQNFAEPCNSIRTNFFLLFPFLRNVLFKNLNDATLSSLGNTLNMQIKAAIAENLVFVNISVTSMVSRVLVSISMF